MIFGLLLASACAGDQLATVAGEPLVVPDAEPEEVVPEPFPTETMGDPAEAWPEVIISEEPVVEEPEEVVLPEEVPIELLESACDLSDPDLEFVELIAGERDGFVGPANWGGEHHATNSWENHIRDIYVSLASHHRYIGFDAPEGFDHAYGASFSLEPYKGRIKCGALAVSVRDEGSAIATDSLSMRLGPMDENLPVSDWAALPGYGAFGFGFTNSGEYASTDEFGNDAVLLYLDFTDHQWGPDNADFIELLNYEEDSRAWGAHIFGQDDHTPDYVSIVLGLSRE